MAQQIIEEKYTSASGKGREGSRMGNALKKGLFYNWNFPSRASSTPMKPLRPPLRPISSPTLAAHLALVDGYCPGQLEGQLLPAEELAPGDLHRPAVSVDDLSDSTQEPHPGQP